MARRETWERLRYFKPDGLDNFGEPDLIDDKLLLRLDDFRHWLGIPIYVTHGVKKEGHSKGSYHYVENGACAVDIIIPDYHNTGVDLVLDANRFGFVGIGYYPHWRWNDREVGGLHLDMRPLGRHQGLHYKGARWMGVMENGKQVYKPLDYEHFLKHDLDVRLRGLN